MLVVVVEVVWQWLDSCEYLWTFLSKLYATAGDLNTETLGDSLKQLGILYVCFFLVSKVSESRAELFQSVPMSHAIDAKLLLFSPFVVFNCSWL